MHNVYTCVVYPQHQLYGFDVFHVRNRPRKTSCNENKTEFFGDRTARKRVFQVREQSKTTFPKSIRLGRRRRTNNNVYYHHVRHRWPRSYYRWRWRRRREKRAETAACRYKPVKIWSRGNLSRRRIWPDPNWRWRSVLIRKGPTGSFVAHCVWGPGAIVLSSIKTPENSHRVLPVNEASVVRTRNGSAKSCSKYFGKTLSERVLFRSKKPLKLFGFVRVSIYTVPEFGAHCAPRDFKRIGRARGTTR